jgi:hypothetical protein
MIGSFRAAGEARQGSMISADQSLFLFPAPAFDPPLGGNNVLYSLKLLVEYQAHRTSVRGIAIEGSRFVLGHAPFQCFSCQTDVVGLIRTSQDVNNGRGAHYCTPACASFETALRASSGWGMAILASTKAQTELREQVEQSSS